MRMLLAAWAFWILAGGSAWASLDEDDKKWILEVKPLMLEDEEKLLASLKTKADRLEFREIFWARRDPDLFTKENEFRTVFEQRKPEADKRFFVGAYIPVARSTDGLGSRPRKSQDTFGGNSGESAAMEETRLRWLRDQKERGETPGGLTDCGLFYLVFGDPDDISKRPLTPWGMREPQVWTYKSRESKFLFDEACMLPVGNDKVRRSVKEQAIVQPLIEYHVKGGELLKKLAEMMPKPTPTWELLRAPREDFAMATEPYFLKSETGTVVVGLVRGDAGNLFHEQTGGDRVRVVIRAEVSDESGGATASEREVSADVDSGGQFLASYRVAAKGGPHTLKIAVLDANSNKGSVLVQPLDVPDYSGVAGTLTIAPVLPLRAVEEGAQKDPKHPMEAFRVGPDRYLPTFGNSFRQSEALTVFYQFYNPKPDPATNHAATTAKVRIVRATGSLIAEGPEDDFDTEIGGTLIGPMSLARYPPGKYKIEVKVTDKVAAQTYTREAVFEVKADTPSATAN